MVYQFRQGARFPVSAEAVGAACEEIRARLGVVNARDVVHLATPEDHPLHPGFEWDDRRAGHLYREDQARLLIRSVVLVDDDSDEPTPLQAFVSVTTEDHGSGYLPTSFVMLNEDLREQAMEAALAGLRGWQRRFEHLGELRGVFQAIERAVRRVKRPKAARPQAVAE